MTDFRFKLMQDGMEVAGVCGPNRDAALAEIMHYAMIYSQDGPVKVVEVKRRKRKSAHGQRPTEETK